MNGSIAPYLAHSFGLDDSGIARLFASFGLSSALALVLGRMADRIGRRRVLRSCLAGLPCAALGSALAPSLEIFVVAQIAAQALGATLFATVLIVLVEELPDERRAAGLARAGTAFAAATAAPLLLATALAGLANGWRAVFALAVLPALAWPWLSTRVPETARWREASRAGRTRTARARDLFSPLHRSTTLALLAASALVQGMEGCARVWLLYHAVRGIGLDPTRATALLICAGGAGLVGFPLGARASDRLGRRVTFALAGVVFVVGALLYYAQPAAGSAVRLPGIALGLFAISLGGNAALTAYRALANEALPTELRGSLGGCLCLAGAIGWLGGMLAVATLAPRVGGTGPATAAIATVALPIAAALLASVREARLLTRGEAETRASAPGLVKLP